MAVRIPLELPREAPGFDRIVVLGLRFSSGPDENAALVRRLLEAQRFSRGLSLIPQGTPTNNTDGAKSGLATGDQSIEEGFALERDPETLTPRPTTSGKPTASVSPKRSASRSTWSALFRLPAAWTPRRRSP